ncbi:hypothetical protein BN1356_00476 [Streptococcus varani]|uniref:Uncharacterized protein n=1 Tax=Streptococcus varani TaxID=1608583 RepID=A0A0E4H490_9STRE|nr:hypothetical protein [Streptococcus varani]CQR24113.1 hypothetical protein BN1356_00476 [Streptococcus varani]
MFDFKGLFLFLIQQQLLFYVIIWILFKDVKYKKIAMILGLIAYETIRYLLMSGVVIPYID